MENPLLMRDEKYVMTWVSGTFAASGTYYNPSGIQFYLGEATTSNLSDITVSTGIPVGKLNSCRYNTVVLCCDWTKSSATKLTMKLSGKQAFDSAFRQYATGTISAGVYTGNLLSLEYTDASFITDPITIIDGWLEIKAKLTGNPANSKLVIRPIFTNR